MAVNYCGRSSLSPLSLRTPRLFVDGGLSSGLDPESEAGYAPFMLPDWDRPGGLKLASEPFVIV